MQTIPFLLLIFAVIAAISVLIFFINYKPKRPEDCECFVSCEGCGKSFDWELLHSDSDSNWLCKDCYGAMIEDFKTWICKGCGKVPGPGVEWAGDNFCQSCEDKEMMAHNARVRGLNQFDKIYFVNESLPYEIKALNDRYAVCVRGLNKEHDHDLLSFKVEMQAYLTIESAYEALKDAPVYCLVDFWERLRAPDNYGCKFDYETQSGCNEALSELMSGEVELSRRNKTHLQIDETRTRYANLKTPPSER